jgi:hypothetical protein
MFRRIETTEGNIELINITQITKCFLLKSGDIQIKLTDGSWVNTSMNCMDLEDLLK